MTPSPIFGPRARRRQPASSIAAPSASVPGATPVEPSIDDRLIAILDAPPALGETIATSFARKEAELLALLATIEIDTARALHRRLTIEDARDPLVAKLGRLTAMRRQRVVNFLADARRRAAVAIARRYR